MRRSHLAAAAAVLALAAAAGSAVFYAGDVGPSRMDQDSADLYTATVDDTAVAFYGALCPPLRDALAAPDALSLSVERATADNGDRDAALVSGAADVADRLRSAAADVRSAQIPAAMYDPALPSPRELPPASAAVADALDAAAELAVRETGDVQAQVGEAADAVATAVSDLADAVPIPTDATAAAVGRNPACDEVFFRPGRVGSDAYPDAVDFHVWAAEASDLFAAGTDRLSTESEYADMDDVAAAWRERATGARNAAAALERWVAPARDPEGVYEGYAQARDELVAAYRAAAEQADASAVTMAATAPEQAQTVMEDMARAAGETSTDVAVASVRAAREARVPNEATATEIDVRRSG